MSAHGVAVSGHGFNRAEKKATGNAALAAEGCTWDTRRTKHPPHRSKHTSRNVDVSVPKHRIHAPGTYFITSRTWENRRVFITVPICQIFIRTLLKYRDENKFMLHAFVLMPDHFHALITLCDETSLERAVQLIKGGSAHAIGTELKFSFPVWQRGYSDHRIRDAADYAKHVGYINLNPVKQKLRPAPHEYPWSSASGKFRLDSCPQGLKPTRDAEPSGMAKAMP